MRPPVVVIRHSSGPRLYVAGRRVHHGTWACALVPIAAWLAYVDRRDWRRWFLNEVMP